MNGEQDVYYSFIMPLITGVEEPTANHDLISLACYPNPFRDQTAIHYKIATDCLVKVSILNIYGGELKTLVDKNQTAGSYTVNFSDGLLPAGFYLCRISAGSQTETTRLIKLK
jgi:hypothetical protein